MSVNNNSLESVIPSDFPRAAYNTVLKRILTASEKIPNQLFGDFHDGWWAVSYRFFACAEHDAAYRASIDRVGGNAPQLEQYIQERELFGFFMNGLTVIESAYYSCYILAGILDPKNFSMTNPKTIQPTSTADKFVKFYKGHMLTTRLDSLRNEVDFKNWNTVRNILAHRILPARLVSVQLFPARPNPPHNVSWTEDNIPLDENTTATRREWLANTVQGIMIGVDEFTTRYFS